MAEQEQIKPWVVVTEGEGALHSSHLTEEQAQGSCEKANQRAEQMDLKVRYKVMALKEFRP